MSRSLALAAVCGVTFAGCYGAVLLLQPLFGWLATPLLMLTGRGVIWLWGQWAIRRDARKLADIQARVLDAWVAHVRRPRPGDATTED